MPGFEIRRICTYANELGAAVTALGNGASLLDVEDAQVATGGLDNTGTVGDRVVPIAKNPRSVQFVLCMCFSPAGRRKGTRIICRVFESFSQGVLTGGGGGR